MVEKQENLFLITIITHSYLKVWVHGCNDGRCTSICGSSRNRGMTEKKPQFPTPINFISAVVPVSISWTGGGGRV